MSKQTIRTGVLSLTFAFLAASGLFFLSACDSAESGGNATLNVKLTDAPLPYDVDSANVTITRVELINASDTLKPIVLMDQPKEFNLLALRNGITADLATVEIPAGTYRQIRLYVAGSPEVVLKSGARYVLKVPSNKIKVLLPDLVVNEADEELDVTLDFDAERSFNVQGKIDSPNSFHFKPVVKVKSVIENAKPVTVTDSLAVVDSTSAN